MLQLRDISIKHKLTWGVMLTTSIALLISGVVFVTTESAGMRNSLERELTSLADIIGTNSTAAIVFQSESDATEVLAALKARPDIVAACIYDAQGRQFAKYIRTDSRNEILPLSPGSLQTEYIDDVIILFRPIRLGDRVVGSCYIKEELTQLQARIDRQLTAVIIAVLVSLILAYLLTIRMRRLIFDPVTHLADVANLVSSQRDYSLRVETAGKDEIGSLVVTFNEMLATVQQRDVALQDAHDGLERRVRERTAEMETEIATRRRAEDALRESEGRFRLISEQSVLGILIIQGNRIEYANQGMADIAEYSIEEMLAWGSGAGFDLLVHPDDALLVADLLERKQAGDDMVVTSNAWRVITRSGQIKWVETYAKSVLLNGRSVVLAAVSDITERKQAEMMQAVIVRISEASHKSISLEELIKVVREELMAIVDTTNFFVAFYDSEQDIYSFPYSIDQYDGFGYPPTRLPLSMTDFVRKTARPQIIRSDRFKRLVSAGVVEAIGQPAEIWLGVPLKASGETIGVMAVQDYSDPDHFTSIDLDRLSVVSEPIARVIERKQAEEDLRASEEKFRKLADLLPQTVFELDTNGRFTYSNRCGFESTGYSEEDIENGLNVLDVCLPEDRPRIQERWPKILAGEPVEAPELSVLRKDGTHYPALLYVQPVVVKDRAIGLRGIIVDISERIRNEAQKERLEKAERMESLGILAGGVAHDLNNMLGPLVGYPELILRKLSEDDPMRRQIMRMGSSARDAADVIQDLLTLARRGRYEMKSTSLNLVIEEYLDSPAFSGLLERRPDITVNKDLDPAIGSITGSSPHLSKVVMNLIVNACDAMPDGGTVEVFTTQDYVEKLASSPLRIEPGEYILLHVRDTGMGIAKEDLEKIFEPYYSKKKMGTSGSGLGLSVVYGIVKDHKGFYDIISTVGSGTEFVLYFPMTEDDTDSSRDKRMSLEGAETVLVVDDVEEQREIGAELLSSLGYQVKTAVNGRDALRILKDTEVDILVLDMIMEADFDGLDTYREVIGLYPGQKAVIVSGFSPTDRVEEMRRLGAGGYVKKPYTRDTLGVAIRKELDKPGTPKPLPSLS